MEPTNHPGYPRLVVLAFGVLAVAHSAEQEHSMRAGELKCAAWGVVIVAALAIILWVTVG